MIVNRIIALVIGYICGLFLSGYAYSKSKKQDITKMGSGNAGTTNTFRIYGWKGGLLTLIGDVSKPIIAIIVTWLIFHNSQYETVRESVRLLEFYAGFGCILGHNFPFYMKFKGGKGIACTGGLVLAFCPIVAPISLSIFILTVALTKYVSLGSILAVISFFVQLVIYGELGILNLTAAYKIEIYIVAGIMTALAVVRHKENIKRLLSGTENKFSFSKQKDGQKEGK
ncbi:MAG: glycerol-3-phosphate 1-O-acyltransferase PlsY [Roseburia sp.]|nr:glycerol-3-phosphate 1-O-acyltransferase PlsY [Roseburia sp.]